MKSLTIRQPWAQLVASGVKVIETRRRPMGYRGLLAVHAGLHPPPKCTRCNGTGMPGPEGDACDWCAGDGVDTIGEVTSEELVYGAVVAVVELVDCVPSDPTLWSVKTGGPYTGSCKLGDGSEAILWWGDGQRKITYDWDEQAPYCDYENNGWAYLLADARPLAVPYQMQGHQGLRDVPPDWENQILAAVS